MTDVDWDRATAYAAWLDGPGTPKGYALPTEAQWEHACRAGTTTRWSFGDDEARLEEHAWFEGNSGGTTHPVGEKTPNRWGLHDMHGNVWEWCADDWHDTYEGAPTDGRAWVDSPRAALRVRRGGSWGLTARVARSAFRRGVEPSLHNSNLGFRLARAVTLPADDPPSWAKVSAEQLAEAARLKVPVAYEEPTTGIRFVLIPGVTFLMGSPEGEEDRFSDEGPQHRVTLGAYYLSVHEVTNGQFERFVKATGHVTTAEREGKGIALNPETGWEMVEGVSWRRPLFGGGAPAGWERHPVVLVSWEDATAFAGWAQATLPSEAQFEYALRGGRRSEAYPWGSGSTPPARFGNYRGEEFRRAFPKLSFEFIAGYDDGHAGTAPVGSFAVDVFGLFDVSGNVWEWCADDYHSTYAGAPTDGRAWVDSPRAALRVFRGGSWFSTALFVRSADRGRFEPSDRLGNLGFRLARAVTTR